jgi:hypothetical protein
MTGCDPKEVAPNHGISLDDGLPAQDNVLGAMDKRSAGDFVACILGWMLTESGPLKNREG